MSDNLPEKHPELSLKTTQNKTNEKSNTPHPLVNANFGGGGIPKEARC